MRYRGSRGRAARRVRRHDRAAAGIWRFVSVHHISDPARLVAGKKRRLPAKWIAPR